MSVSLRGQVYQVVRDGQLIGEIWEEDDGQYVAQIEETMTAEDVRELLTLMNKLEKEQ